MAQTILNPYIQFNGQTAEALDFYKNIFGGEAEVSYFKDVPNMPVTEEQKDQIMHAVLKFNAMQLMFSDAMSEDTQQPSKNISLSLSGDDEATLTSYFKGLSDGGTVTQPLEIQAWGDLFGMITDRFGVSWMVNISKTQA